MINFIEQYSFYLALSFIVLSQSANGFGDAIKFTNVKISKKFDNLWHWIKWGIDRPTLLLTGFCSYPLLMSQFKNDFWHYDNKFLWWAFVFLNSFFIWQIIHKISETYFQEKYKAK